jgi:transposase
MRSQTVEEFITASEHAMHFYNGVPLALVPDNLKSAVFKADKFEPQLNVNFAAFADHYGTSILPARVRKPQDKSLVEGMVKICYQRIYTNMPQHELLTLTQLNQEIRKYLKELNNDRLTGKDYSRHERFLLEIQSLQPLPATRFEMREIKQVTVMKNGHVLLHADKHYYSVPCHLIGKRLQLQYSRTRVELYDQYQLVASHERIRSPHNYTTTPDHMPSTHRYITEWSPSFFIDKAKEIDPIVEHYIAQVLAKKIYPEQAYRSCQGILSFAGKVGKERLIKACQRSAEIGYYNYKTIEDILKRHLENNDDDKLSVQMPVHENIRGGGYYQ